MQQKRLWQILGMIGFLCLLLFVGACKKKVAPPPPPPPPPPPAAPTVTLRANPAMIERGQSSRLEWTSSNATELSIAPGVGTVESSGSTTVSPRDSTTYTITAKGPGGTASDSARVTVTVPPPPPPPPPPKPEAKFEDAYFDFDKSDIRPDAREALTRDAEVLRDNPNVRVLLEGHCDERGSTEYNLGLGDRRANAAKSFLVSAGIAESRLETKSWGKERPICTEHNEECWQRNRRAHFVITSK